MNVEEGLPDRLKKIFYDVIQEGLSDELKEALYDVAKYEFNDFLFHLISYRHYFPFLERLFSVNPGEWLDLELLCDDYESITTRLQRLRKVKALRAPVDVTWLDYSHSPYGQGFCLIVFYCETPLWSTNMIYNKRYILQTMNKIIQANAPKKKIFSENELETLHDVAEKSLSDALEEALYNVAKKELEDLTYYLVTQQDYYPALQRLFSVKAGEWLDLKSLCDYDEDVVKRLQKLRKVKGLRASIDVTWLDYSHSSYGKGYCLIVFYSAVPVWSRNIIYNQNYFFDEIAVGKSTKPENKAVFS